MFSAVTVQKASPGIFTPAPGEVPVVGGAADGVGQSARILGRDH